MLLSEFHFKLLKYIYKHPYIEGEVVKNSYMSSKRHRYNDRHFINALEFLCRSGYIDCTFFKSAEEDTGQRVRPDDQLFALQTSLELLKDGIFIPEEISIVLTIIILLLKPEPVLFKKNIQSDSAPGFPGVLRLSLLSPVF